MPQKLNAQQINAVLGNVTSTAAEATYTTGAWVAISGMSVDIKTTRANQEVVCISKFQTYSGGFSEFQYYLDGAAIGTAVKYQTATNAATTGNFVFYDWFAIPTAGAHTISVRAKGGANTLRIIHSEGPGKMSVIIGA